MTVSARVIADTTVRVWSASGDSRVGIATPFPTPEGCRPRYCIQLINQPNMKLVHVTGDELNTEWLLSPRIDARWVNVGSVWVRNNEHKSWKRPVPSLVWCEVCEVKKRSVCYCLRHDSEYGPVVSHYYQEYTTFTTLYTRLWGQETPKGEIPQEPLPFKPRKAPGRPKKVKEGPKSVLDRLLEGDLIPE